MRLNRLEVLAKLERLQARIVAETWKDETAKQQVLAGIQLSIDYLRSNWYWDNETPK